MYVIAPKCKQFFFHSVKCVKFHDKKRVFTGNFSAIFYSKKSAVEIHRILVETYGDHAMSKTIFRDWFRRFKNNDFDVEDKDALAQQKSLKTKNWNHYFTHVRR